MFKTFFVFGSEEFSKIGWQVPTAFLKVTQTVLRAKHGLVVERVHELLQVLKVCICIVSSFHLLVCMGLVDPILQILLNRAC